MVPTNGSDSGICLDDDTTRKFEQPSVNVKLLSLNIGDDETTVFKGDPIDPSGYVSELAKKLKVIELDGKTTTLTGVSPLTADKSAVNLTLTPDQITELRTITLGEKNSDGTYPYEYIYPGTTDAVGYFTYTYKLSADRPNGKMDPHEATTVGTAVEKYELVVTYHPYSTETRKKDILELSKIKVPAENGGTEVTSGDIAPVTGTYKVNVIAGQIEITKKLSGDETAQQDAEFTFEIYKVVTKDGNRVEEKLTTDPEIITANINTGENVAKFGNDNDTKVTITGLSRGDYIVRETSHNGYTLESAVYNTETNCLAVNNDASKDVTFTIGTYGTDTEKKNALEAKELKNVVNEYDTYKGPGCVGVADFTNKEIVADVGFVKIDAAKDLNNHTITLSGVEFKLYKANDKWEQGNLVNDNVKSGTDGTFELEKLLPGNYLLVETKAATGYSVPKDPWRIKVDSEGTVTVTKTNGIPIKLTEYDNKKVYQLENAKVYSLPQSGGPGTYGFTISGVAILATALLLFINNKRREEEAKRS